MTDHTTLIRDLEAATEGSRELDETLWAYLQGWNYPECFYETDTRGIADSENAPHYTTSLDAALTLVPEGYGIENFMIWPGEPSTIMLVGTHLREGRYWHEAPKDGRWRAEASTPALALCIAALKARSAA